MSRIKQPCPNHQLHDLHFDCRCCDCDTTSACGCEQQRQRPRAVKPERFTAGLKPTPQPITRRDLFAAAALITLSPRAEEDDINLTDVALMAWDTADAMIAADPEVK